MFDLQKIQEALREEKMAAWLFYNFRNLDASANAILEICSQAVLSRRWFYLIPAEGQPVKLVHKIEPAALDHLPGEKYRYATWQQLHQQLQKLVSSYDKVCMQYSPLNAIPYVSHVDGGTLELVKKSGTQVCSSANLIQKFQAVWSEQGLHSHQRAAKKIRQIVLQAFSKVKQCIEDDQQITEYQLQQYILQQFADHRLYCDHPPIVAINANSGDPHYEPSADNSTAICRDDKLLIDLWAKEKETDSVYADITWVGVVAHQVPQDYQQIFYIVRDARNAAVDLIVERLGKEQEVYGYQVDDACRQVMEKAGYGDYFIHRTGHSIGQEVHWKGVNIDNFETKDERKLIDGIGFSIEPGIYLDNFGIRSEINVYLDQGKAHVSGQPIQQEVIAILATDFS